jgi:glutamate-1-semialdehyde 2,1-aminomutase
MYEIPKSEALMRRAQGILPGGVNSPVRAHKGVGGVPAFMTRGAGAMLYDVDGHEYVDLVLAYGPLILGHGHPAIMNAVSGAAARGLAFGAPTEGEVELAETVQARMPSIEMLRLVNSGTEATMSALRLARAFTGRDKLIKFDGNYHGHGDAFLVKAGSGALTGGAPDSPGVPASVARDTLVADYNDLESVASLFAQHPGAIAAVIVEPVAGNVGLINPAPGFLEGLRTLCDQHGSLLVFDEVMTGFRVARGSYQQVCGVKPDLTTLGKIIGHGLPVGAYGGRRDVMQLIAPSGAVYQAGTLSGNPLAVAAGLAALTELDRVGVYDALEDAGAHLAAGLEAIFHRKRIPAQVNREGSMLSVYFSAQPVTTLAGAMSSNREQFRSFFHRMREHGVLLPPSPFESWFLSTAHTADVLDRILEAAAQSLD